MEKSKAKDPIPEAFNSIEEAAEFWDKHSLADYWDETQEVDIEVRIPRRTRITLAAEIARQVAKAARREGVSVETLVNLWVAERLDYAALYGSIQKADKQIAEGDTYSFEEVPGDDE